MLLNPPSALNCVRPSEGENFSCPLRSSSSQAAAGVGGSPLIFQILCRATYLLASLATQSTRTALPSDIRRCRSGMPPARVPGSMSSCGRSNAWAVTHANVPGLIITMMIARPIPAADIVTIAGRAAVTVLVRPGRLSYQPKFCATTL
jgi:hypothetical protein